MNNLTKIHIALLAGLLAGMLHYSMLDFYAVFQRQADNQATWYQIQSDWRKEDKRPDTVSHAAQIVSSSAPWEFHWESYFFAVWTGCLVFHLIDLKKK